MRRISINLTWYNLKTHKNTSARPWRGLSECESSWRLEGWPKITQTGLFFWRGTYFTNWLCKTANFYQLSKCVGFGNLTPFVPPYPSAQFPLELGGYWDLQHLGGGGCVVVAGMLVFRSHKECTVSAENVRHHHWWKFAVARHSGAVARNQFLRLPADLSTKPGQIWYQNKAFSPMKAS